MKTLAGLLENKFKDLGGLKGAKELVADMDFTDDFFSGLGDKLVELDLEKEMENKTAEALKPKPEPEKKLVTKKMSSNRRSDRHMIAK